MDVEIIDPVADYVDLLKDIFDFPGLKAYVQQAKTKLLFDSMHGGVCVGGGVAYLRTTLIQQGSRLTLLQ